MNYSVYVIRLYSSYCEEAKAKRENPNYTQGKPCVYVGSTSLSPEERYKTHLNKGISLKTGKQIGGKKKAVKKYKFMYKKNGLRPKQYNKYNPIKNREEAEKIEKKLAEKLRKKGYCVWYG